MAFPRLAGVILHPTSLPGGHGIGLEHGIGSLDHCVPFRIVVYLLIA